MTLSSIITFIIGFSTSTFLIISGVRGIKSYNNHIEDEKFFKNYTLSKTEDIMHIAISPTNLLKITIGIIIFIISFILLLIL